MACGTPVVTSNTSAIPEVAGPGAILVDPTSPTAIADALLRLETDPAFRAEQVAYGLERVKLFSWEETAGSCWRFTNRSADRAQTRPPPRIGGAAGRNRPKRPIKKGRALPFLFPFPVFAVLFSLHEVLLHAVQIPLLRHRAARLRPFEHLGISLQEIGLLVGMLNVEGNIDRPDQPVVRIVEAAGSVGIGALSGQRIVVGRRGGRRLETAPVVIYAAAVRFPVAGSGRNRTYRKPHSRWRSNCGNRP